METRLTPSSHTISPMEAAVSPDPNAEVARVRQRSNPTPEYDGRENVGERRILGIRFRTPNPAPVQTWTMSFGTISAVGFVGSSMTFSVIFTAPRELASPKQITFMCWAFSCYTTAFAAGASVQIFLTMVRPTVGEQPARSKHSWLLNVALYFSVTLVSTGTFLLGVAILEKVKGAGICAVVFPSAIVILTVVAAAYVNHVGGDAEILESRGDIEEGKPVLNRRRTE